MQYYKNSIKKEYFLITPKEFENVFADYTFVSTSGVKKGYVSSERSEIFNLYRQYYQLLASGKRCVWAEDCKTLSFRVGVTSHTENIRYEKTDRLSIPDFIEPCIELESFCAVPYKDNPVSLGWAVHQHPQYLFGLVMCFPLKVTYKDNTVKTFDKLKDRETWCAIHDKLKSFAPTLYIDKNGKKYKSRIRVSSDAKKDALNFNAVRESGIVII